MQPRQDFGQFDRTAMQFARLDHELVKGATDIESADMVKEI